MKQIRYSALIKEVDTSRTWREDFADLVVDSTTPLSHCKFLICKFNCTLRPGEKPREVVKVRNLPISTLLKEHNWNKLSWNLVEGKYHIYACANCGITGKRYGIADFVTPDRKNTIYCKTQMKRTS